MPARVRTAEVRAEHLLTELLVAQGWDTRKPPAGELLRQQEYRDFPDLLDIFRGKGKKGKGGDALPEAVLLDRDTEMPLAVIEAKASSREIEAAKKDALHYGAACVEAGYVPLAIALAGDNDEDFALRVFKWTGTRWSPVTYDKDPITWIPNRADTERLIPIGAKSELRPSVPPPDVLHAHAEEINRLLRESGISDARRPSVVGTIMLALWRSRGNLHKDKDNILSDINRSCHQAFWHAEKPELQENLRVDENNERLAINARRIVSILERLNVHVLTAEHDYLGQLYEEFFRYTGGNTIGQYFTPRHIAKMMAEMLEVGSTDIVLDPACGTGGFLIAAMNRILVQRKLSRAQVVKLVRKKLIGIENEPQTAAIAVANMILRGDGSTGIHRADCFSWPDYPRGKATVSLLNPPFPHKKTDTPPAAFVDRALEGLQQGGRLAVIVPTSMLVKRDRLDWRRQTMKKHTVEAVIGLPDELFEPYASSYTSVLIIKKGVPHRSNRKVFFARITNDGLRIRKRVRMPCEGEQLSDVMEAFRDRLEIPGLCGWDTLGEVWGAGLYVPARVLGDDELVDGAMALARDKTAFVVRHAPNLRAFQAAIEADEFSIRSYTRMKRPTAIEAEPGTIGEHFHIFYGQKALHSKEHLEPGLALVISSSGIDNGCYGFFDFDDLIAPPFITVPSTGSFGEARVQTWPCGVADDCLILVPKNEVPRELLFVAATVIRNERWRFNYGMKVTPSRIAGYPLPIDDETMAKVGASIAGLEALERMAVEGAEDEIDSSIARKRLREIRDRRDALVSGEKLKTRLSDIT